MGRHQHLPEIQEAVQQFAGVHIQPHMVTSLLPVRRGIIAGIYGNLLGSTSATEVQMALNKYYGAHSLIEVAPLAERAGLLSLRRVVGTAKTQISFSVEGQKLYLFSVLDNLLKGAAAQAVENLNRFLDAPTETGLTSLEATL